MTTLLIFIPSLLYEQESGYLQGVVYNFPEKDVKTVVIYGKLIETAENGSTRYCVWENVDTIGYYYRSDSRNFHFVPRKSNWISIGIKLGEFYIKDALCSSLSIPVEQCRLFVYNKNEFLQSELLLKQFDLSEKQLDCFKTLTHSLESLNSEQNYESLIMITIPFLFILLKLFNFVLDYSTKALPILRFSSLGTHCHNYFKNVTWTLSSLYNDKKLTLKTGNYILALFADMLCGILILHWLINFYTVTEFFNLICGKSEGVVLSLRKLIEWLMGSPGGLKLNFPLNSVLGKFFLFHIDLWWSFLGLVRPVLEFGFHVFLLIGKLGLSFQTAIIADFLALSSFHVYCIYVYAARLYNLQLRGLGSLSRLFIGCKRNPIPGKVDSCPYTTEQLFVGTIAFTVLLFLLPTTFVYYIVFTAMRLVVIGIGGLLTRTRFILQSLPFNVLIMWFFNPVLTTSSVEIVPKMVESSLVFYVQPICGTLWYTILACIPDQVDRPTPVKYGSLVRDIITGRLIYPV